MDHDDCDPSELETFLQSCLDNASLLDPVDALGSGSAGSALASNGSTGPIAPLSPLLGPLSTPARLGPMAGTGLAPMRSTVYPPAHSTSSPLSLTSPVTGIGSWVPTKAALKQLPSPSAPQLHASGAVAMPPHLPNMAAVAPFPAPSLAPALRARASPASATSPATFVARSPPASHMSRPQSLLSPPPPTSAATPPVLTASLSPAATSTRSSSGVASVAVTTETASATSTSTPSGSAPAVSSALKATAAVPAPVSALVRPTAAAVSVPVLVSRSAAPLPAVAAGLTPPTGVSTPTLVVAASSAGAQSLSHPQLTALRPHLPAISPAGVFAASGASPLLPVVAAAHPGGAAIVVCAGTSAAAAAHLLPTPTASTPFMAAHPHRLTVSSSSAAAAATIATLTNGFSNNVKQHPHLLPKTLAPALAASTASSAALKHPAGIQLLAPGGTGGAAAAAATTGMPPLLLTPVMVPQPGGGMQLQYMLREQPAAVPPTVPLMLPAAPGPGARLQQTAVLLPSAGGGHTAILLPSSQAAGAGMRFVAPSSLLALQPSLFAAPAPAPTGRTTSATPAATVKSTTPSGRKRRRDTDTSSTPSTVSAKRTFVDLEEVMKKSGILSDIIDDTDCCEQNEINTTMSAVVSSEAPLSNISHQSASSSPSSSSSTTKTVAVSVAPSVNGVGNGSVHSVVSPLSSVRSNATKSSVIVKNSVAGSSNQTVFNGTVPSPAANGVLSFSSSHSSVISCRGQDSRISTLHLPSSSSTSSSPLSLTSRTLLVKDQKKNVHAVSPAATVVSLSHSARTLINGVSHRAQISSSHQPPSCQSSPSPSSLSSSSSSSVSKLGRNAETHPPLVAVGCVSSSVGSEPAISTASAATTLVPAVSKSDDCSKFSVSVNECEISMADVASPLSSLSPPPPPSLSPACVSPSLSSPPVTSETQRTAQCWPVAKPDAQCCSTGSISKHQQQQSYSRRQAERRERMSVQLANDCSAALSPDTDRPFSSVKDAIHRLSSFHVLSDSSTATSTSSAASADCLQALAADHLFMARAKYIEHRRQYMTHKYRRLLLKDSMRVHPTCETVQLLRYLNQHDREQLKAERELAASQHTTDAGSPCASSQSPPPISSDSHPPPVKPALASPTSASAVSSCQPPSLQPPLSSSSLSSSSPSLGYGTSNQSALDQAVCSILL